MEHLQQENYLTWAQLAKQRYRWFWDLHFVKGWRKESIEIDLELSLLNQVFNLRTWIVWLENLEFSDGEALHYCSCCETCNNV